MGPSSLPPPLIKCSLFWVWSVFPHDSGCAVRLEYYSSDMSFLGYKSRGHDIHLPLIGNGNFDNSVKVISDFFTK